jgi:predicted nucleic acid-binding protein
MPKIRSFLDAGILIVAHRGKPQSAQAAFKVLGDPDREFASSLYVQLEILPKALYFKRASESVFYASYFQSVTHWSQPTEGLLNRATELASRYGLSALDALHVAAALATDSHEFVTTEQKNKPIHRVQEIAVVSIP